MLLEESQDEHVTNSIRSDYSEVVFLILAFFTYQSVDTYFNFRCIN